MIIRAKLMHILLLSISICIGFFFVSLLGLGEGVQSFYKNAEQVKISGRAKFHVGTRGTSSYITIDGAGDKNHDRVVCPYSHQNIPCGNPEVMRNLLRVDQVFITYYKLSEPNPGGVLGEVKSIETPAILLTEDPLQRVPSQGNRIFSIALSMILSAILYAAFFSLFKLTGVLPK